MRLTTKVKYLELMHYQVEAFLKQLDSEGCSPEQIRVGMQMILDLGLLRQQSTPVKNLCTDLLSVGLIKRRILDRTMCKLEA
jgi:hypothetical protein